MNQEQITLSNLPEEVVLSVTSKFQEFQNIVTEWGEKAYSINVTDVNQVELMQQAKEGRSFLRAKRLEIEKTRVRLKEQSLNEGRFIDKIAKDLMTIIKPAEEHLELQEKFKEIQDELEKTKLKNDRLELLKPYIDFVDLNSFDLKTMSDVAFNTILLGSKSAYNQHLEDLEKLRIEQERLDAEKKQQEIKSKSFGERQIAISPYNYFLLKGEYINIDTTEEEFVTLFENLKERKQNFDVKNNLFQIRKNNLSSLMYFALPNEQITIDSTEEEYNSLYAILNERKEENEKEKQLLQKKNDELKKQVIQSEKKIINLAQKSNEIDKTAKINLNDFKTELEMVKLEHQEMKQLLLFANTLIIHSDLRLKIELLLKKLKF
jgi:hypothetical protein